MNPCSRMIAFSFLLTVASAALPAQAVRLTVDRNSHGLGVLAGLDGAVFLAVGVRAVPPIKLAGIELDVVPHFVLALGRVAAGEMLELFVPEDLRGFEAEAVLVDDDARLHDSNVASLADAYADLIDATFHAELREDAAADPRYTLAASLTAATSGYELQFDAAETAGDATDVYLRLVAPGPDEAVMPVLTDVRVSAALGDSVGARVRVHLMRTQRGMAGAQVYRQMVELRRGDGGR